MDSASPSSFTDVRLLLPTENNFAALSATIPGDDAIDVQAELVLNPLTKAPYRRGPASRYRIEYCDLILKFFAEMLEQSGIKLQEGITEEKREKAKAPENAIASDAAVEESKPRPGGHKLRKLEIIEKRTIQRKEWRLVCAELPSFAKFGRLVGVSTDTLVNWRRLNPAFDDACKMAADMACDALLQRGLHGQYDPEMVKFVGKNWFGLADRHEITGAEGAPLNPPAQLRHVSLAELDEAERGLREIKRRLLEGTTARGEITG